MMQSVEIFTGAGGLALGIARAGFNHCLAVECNFSACQTLFLNQDQIFTQNNLPYIFQAKVEEFDFSLIDKKVDLLAGGPPCQPFSHGGLHQGLLHKRDMFPQSQETLLWSQWVTGEYWEQYKIRKPEPPEKLVSKIQKLQSRLLTPEKQRWLTVRDAIHDLPDPTQIKTQNICNHWFVPGAKVYPGHTGSPVDEPAKTLKAGVHGVPGGENMIRFSNGTVRYFTIREAARLQTFPDTYTKSIIIYLC